MGCGWVGVGGVGWGEAGLVGSVVREVEEWGVKGEFGGSVASGFLLE